MRSKVRLFLGFKLHVPLMAFAFLYHADQKPKYDCRDTGCFQGAQHLKPLPLFEEFPTLYES